MPALKASRSTWKRARLVFRRVHGPKREGAGAQSAVRTRFIRLYGAMQGLIRIMPGTDLTQPADPGWAGRLDAAYGNEKRAGIDAAAVLDTCTLDLHLRKARLSPAALEALRAATARAADSYISPITAWEVGMLASRGRLQLLIRPERWFSNLFEVPGVRLAEMSPDVLIASSYLPGQAAEGPD